MTFKHGHFNRHEVFQKRDLHLILDIIDRIRYSDTDNGNLVNMLFGLFDGYWYYGIQSAVDVSKEVPASLKKSFQKLIQRVVKEAYC